MADVRVRLKYHAFGSHLLQAAVENILFHLEIGDAIAQQAADAVGFFKERHGVACAIQLLRGRHARRSRSHNGDALACSLFRWLRLDPSFVPGVLDDRFLDHLDCDRRFVDPKHAGRFARRRTDASGKFREIIRGVQHANRFFPLVAINEIVPVGNDVGHGTAGVAERNSAIHAARRLRAHFFFAERLIDFEIVVDALVNGAARRQFARVFLESGNLTHGSPCPHSWFRGLRGDHARGHSAEFPARACIRAGKL